MRKHIIPSFTLIIRKSGYLKKSVSMLLIAGMLVSFTACGLKESENKASDPTVKTGQDTVMVTSDCKEKVPQTSKPEVSGTETTKPSITDTEKTSGTGSASKTDYMEGITGSDISVLEDLSVGNKAYTEFALKLFKKCNTDKDNNSNMLLSPLSVIYALGMTSSGSAGTTAEQFEKLYGISQEDLNKYMYSYLKGLSDDEAAHFAIANSIWINKLRSDRKPLDTFLHNVADYYDAKIFGINFDAENIHFINDWVNEKTEGMIPSIIDRPMPDALMCLVNAIAFDAKWEDEYEESDIRDGEFTLEDGTKKNVSYLHSEESIYLKDDNAQGFIKYYKGKKYAFAAILPEKGITLDDYIASLDGEKIQKMLASQSEESVICTIPKFEVKYKAELCSFLSSMGITEAFNPYKADFTKMYEGNGVYIDEVLHKTYLKLDENGTKAAAATAIIMKNTGAVMGEYVFLDRPFVYMLIDCENNIPIFIGRYDGTKE